VSTDCLLRSPRIRLSLVASTRRALIALGRKEIGRATEDADATITLSGETTLRVVHPHAGDATAAPFVVFLEPILPEVVTEPGAVGGPAQANPNDVATLKASKNCAFCNLAGLSWNACPAGASWRVSISATPTSPWRTWRV
jgi:hypothetical protein